MPIFPRASASERRRRWASTLAHEGRVLLSGLVLAASAVAARAADVPITWAIYDAPPFMIADGPDRDSGVFDRIRHLLDQRLAGAPQVTLVAPFPRLLASLREGGPLCFIGGVETPERDGFALFSLPVAMFYPLRIVVHATERARFEARGGLSLKGLLADPALRSSMLKDRSFGGPVDAIFHHNPPSRMHSDFGEAFNMLLADRLDYLVDYSAIAAYGAKRLGHPGALVELPFAEAPAPVFSRVMCPKTDWGRQTIARIDAILRVERPSRAYRDMVEAWADTADLATIRDVYDSAFLRTE